MSKKLSDFLFVKYGHIKHYRFIAKLITAVLNILIMTVCAILPLSLLYIGLKKGLVDLSETRVDTFMYAYVPWFIFGYIFGVLPGFDMDIYSQK